MSYERHPSRDQQNCREHDQDCIMFFERARNEPGCLAIAN